MPQDGLRSALYRSLVTCDDPKGVVTCRPLRRSNPSHSHPIRKLGKPSFSDSMEETEPEPHSPASFQLMEVSRGAQKLNRTIQRWSVGARSDDVAADLLRGAIDLQDSLAMLGKLQEASRFMARLKREQAAERPGSDGEELKRVIRESLVKQRLVLPKKKAASASSSSEWSSGSGAARGPNLIAKLMGLEHYPSQAASAKRTEGREAPGERAPERRRTLNEILDSMHFKGLLGSDSSESLDRSPLNAASCSDRNLLDEGPPIVLIKPMRVPYLEEDDPLYRRKMPRKPRGGEELRPRAIPSYRDRALKSYKPVPKPNIEMIHEQRVIIEAPQEKQVSDKANAAAKPIASRPVKKISNEGFEKRVEKIPKPKVIPVDTKSSEKDIAKRRSVPKLDDQAKKTSVKARKPDPQSKVAKIQNSRQPSATKRAERSSASNPPNPKKSYQKKEKLAKKPVSSNSAASLNTHETRVELAGESECREVPVDINKAQLPIVEDQLLKGQDTEIQERWGGGQSCHPHATASTAPSLNCETLNPRDLFTSSLAFKTCAVELFDVNADYSTTLLARPIDGFDESTAKLLVDCAIELMERRSLRDSRTGHPLLPSRAVKQRRRVAVATLVEEVSDGVEALRKFGEAAADCVYTMLERDRACGVWDSGWRDGFRPDDAEQVVSSVERMVLSGLIEEVFT